MFGYIISKSKGLCGGVVCVLSMLLVGGGLLGVSYGVGSVYMGTWRLLEGRVMWGLCVICVIFVFFCVCC